MAGPVHNSAVYVIGQPHHAPTVPPPSPPSPATPAPELCSTIEAFSLDDDVLPPSPSLPGTPTTPKTSVCGDHDTVASSVSSSASQRFEDRLQNAVHVLNTEATSLSLLSEFYTTDPAARSAFNAAVETITSRPRGKLVIIGVGKSGHIARKLVATFNSLSIYASYMHPTEALHGDLGHVGPEDTLMLITFSGKTPELALLLPYLDLTLPLIVLTGRTMEAEVVEQRQGAAEGKTILLPAPVHEAETVSFGVSAPTTSTTMALAVGDALALTCAQEKTPGTGGVAGVFGRNHPGGAIGQTYKGPQTVKDIMIPFDDISIINHSVGAKPLVVGDVLCAAYTCKTGWLRVGADSVVSPSRTRRLNSADLASDLRSLPWLMVDRASFVSIGATTELKVAGAWLRCNMAATPGALLADDEDRCAPDSIVAVVDAGDVVGVLEASAILNLTE